MNANDLVIRTQGLSKTFGEVEALCMPAWATGLADVGGAGALHRLRHRHSTAEASLEDREV